MASRHALGPREVLQLDTIGVEGFVASASIDSYTEEADIRVASTLTIRYGCRFLEEAVAWGALMATCSSSRSTGQRIRRGLPTACADPSPLPSGSSALLEERTGLHRGL